MRGYFAIGVYHSKKEVNIGTLFRSAYQLGAAYVFTIGRRYETQASDTVKSVRQMPVYHFTDFEDFKKHLPFGCPIIGIEEGGKDLATFCHPSVCVYLLGAEDYGLSPQVQKQCHSIVSLESIRVSSFNVAVAGSIVMHDRISKSKPLTSGFDKI